MNIVPAPERGRLSMRTLLIDDNMAFTVLARHVLAGIPPIDVVGTGHDGHDAVRLAEEIQPDLIIMDLAMPGMDGLQAARLIKAQDHPPLILIASHNDDPEHREFAAQSGIDGFISKDCYERGVCEFLERVVREQADA
jgi:DNA-binding NarL/FixJ family response regulator